ncbi:MAG: hypothetical protein D3917_20365, partial [Candidatus Electrothrix sp. AX5]|nr:hypothetical protein [Candidatus Electrothrix sp. AX5]
VWLGGDVDLYGYVLGDPVNFVDPEGELLISAVVVIGIGGYMVINIAEAWIDLKDKAKTARELREASINEPCNEDLYFAQGKAYNDLAKAVGNVGKNTPGTSATGPLPTSKIDLITNFITGLFVD